MNRLKAIVSSLTPCQRIGLQIAAVLLASGAASAFVSEPTIKGTLTLRSFRRGAQECYDRSKRPGLAVVDSHLHVRPFGGPPIPFPELLNYLRNSGILFANIYGIGQRLPIDSPCTYYLNCPGTPVLPSIKNDFVNAQNLLDANTTDLQLTLSMTFADLSHPGDVLPAMALLEKEFPGRFRWMGELNLAKQALYKNAHQAVAMETIKDWKPFMDELKRRNIPISIHSDLGNDAAPFKYVPLMEEVLKRFPENRIVWMHLGISKELKLVDPAQHVELMDHLLSRYPGLYFDLSWRVLYDQIFADPQKRKTYVQLLNKWPDRFIPGTDFVAAAGKSEKDYQEELSLTSSILGDLDDHAFRQIALGQNYFQLAGVDAVSPPICSH